MVTQAYWNLARVCAEDSHSCKNKCEVLYRATLITLVLFNRIHNNGVEAIKSTCTCKCV